MSSHFSKLSVREQAQLKSLLDKVGGVDNLTQSIDDLKIDDDSSFGYGYMRVSDPTRDDPESLKTQEHIIKQLAKQHKVKLIEILQDVGISGSLSADKRPSLREIFWNLQPGQCIISSATDRLFRNSEDDRKTMTDFIKLKQCKIITSDYIPDDDTKPEVAFTQTVSVAAYRLMRDMSIKKTTDALRRKSKEGTLPGKPYYGWRSPGKLQPWVEVEYEQNAISKITQLKLSNPSLLNSEIIEELKKSGFPYAKEYYDEDGSLKKRSKWGHNTIQSILIRSNLASPSRPFFFSNSNLISKSETELI